MTPARTSELSQADLAVARVPDLPPVPAGCKGWPWELPSDAGAPEADMHERWPKITIVTPSYNQGRYLEQTLRSVLCQGYPNLEYIVMDGGSDDDSVEILERYRPRLAYCRSERDAGQSDAIAAGFARATGAIFGYLNSDDLLMPGSLRHVARIFDRRPKVDVVYGNRLVIDERGAVVGRHTWPYLLSRYHWAGGQPLAQECCFWRKDLYWRVGGIDRTKFFIMDYDLFYRMWRTARFRKTRAYLGALRIHGDSKNSRHQDVWRQELAAAKAQFALRDPGYLMARIINRLDRAQSLFDTLAERLWGSKLPEIH